nr:ImmA/IrrE family metallo-endopeptidase [Tissierella sp.]
MYERLIIEAEKENIEVVEISFRSNVKGLYSDGVIATKKSMSNKEKATILAEELGHYHKTYGNILDQSSIINRKEERKARIWAYKRLIGLLDIIDAYKAGIKNRYELSEYLGVTEEFIIEAIEYYRDRYGLYVRLDNYYIYFEPLGVLECL